jgi:hypothetical protein
MTMPYLHRNSLQIMKNKNVVHVVMGPNALAAAVTAASPMEPPGWTRYLTPNLNTSQKHTDAGGSLRQGY